MKKELRRPTFDEIIRYYEITNEIIALDKNIRDYIKKDYSNYRGLQILMTPLVIHPKVMFIGINPGSGYFNNYKNEGLPKENPIYIIDHKPHNNNPFGKQNSFCKLIQSCFYPDDWQTLKKEPNLNLVWCNICPIATPGAGNYRQLLDMAGTVYAWKTLHRTIHQLAILIKPQLILCLGKEAFNEYCNNEFIRDLDNIDKISFPAEEIFQTRSLSTGTPIIGISRLYNELKCNKKEIQQLIHSLI